MSAAGRRHHRPPSTRAASAGYTLAEATAALVVAGLLTAGLASVLALVARGASRHAQMTAAAETERTATAVLGLELRALTAADATFDHDSVRLRAFRGGGVVCERAGAELTLAWRGVRAPEPEKDSLLVLWPDGETVHRMEAVRAAGCDPADPGVRVTLSTLGSDGARPLAAYAFETGAYSLASFAFRYRRGAAGRQPLTDETLSDASSMRMHPGPGTSARVHVALHPRATTSGVTVEWALALPQGSAVPNELSPSTGDE